MGKQQKKGNRYVVYLRCSTDEQTEQGYSTLDAQREHAANYIAKSEGRLIREYSDEGKTGTNLDRPGWQELVRDAKEGKFDVVCATFMSRIARGKAYHIAEDTLKKCGIRIELTQEQFADDFAGQMNQEMVVFMDGMQPKYASHHTKAKMKQMVANGYICGNTVPIGYKSEPANGINALDASKKQPMRMVIDEDSVEIVKSAFQMLLSKRTIASVRDYLKTVTTRKWTIDQAKRLLRNEAYIGVLVFGSWRNSNAHDPIIDNETWQKVQDTLDSLSTSKTRSARDDSYTYYLRGKIRCPHCGCNYTNSFANGRISVVHYYECHNAKKHITKCEVNRINADALHDAVLKAIARAANHHTVMHKIIAESEGWNGVDLQKKELRGQLGKNKQFLGVQIENLMKGIEAGRGSQLLYDRIEQREKELNDITRQIDELDRDIAQSKVIRPTAAQVQAVWSQVVELWADASEEVREELLQGIVDSVDINQKNSVSLHLSPVAKNSEFMVRINEKLGSGGRI